MILKNVYDEYMAEKFKELILKSYNSIFVLTGLLIIFFSVILYSFLGKGAADALIEQMLHREQVVARAGAISLNLFMNSFRDQALTHSLSSSIVSLDSGAQKDLEIFMDKWKDTPVSGTIIVDKKGVVKFGQDRYGATGQGINVSEREYFIWAKTANLGNVKIVEPYQSKIGFTDGRYVISAVVPLFKNGEFNGAFVTGFLLDEAKEQFLDPLNISEKTRTYLIDQNGVILSGPIKKLIGVNYLDYLLKSNIPLSEVLVEKFKDVLKSQKENKLDIILPDENKNGGLTRYLIATSPVAVGDQNWTLAVATPVTDALEFLSPFYFKDLGIAGLAILGFLVIIIRISKIKGHTEGVVEEHKIHSSSTPPEIS